MAKSSGFVLASPQLERSQNVIFQNLFFPREKKLDQHVTPTLGCAVIKAICSFTGFLKLSKVTEISPRQQRRG